jgi:hypothetical protein
MTWRDIGTAPRDGTWFIGKAANDDVPTVMRITGPRRDYDDLDAEPKDWDIHAKALNCSTRTWALSDFTHWAPLPAPPEDGKS